MNVLQREQSAKIRHSRTRRDREGLTALPCLYVRLRNEEEKASSSLLSAFRNRLCFDLVRPVAPEVEDRPGFCQIESCVGVESRQSRDAASSGAETSWDD